MNRFFALLAATGFLQLSVAASSAAAPQVVLQDPPPAAAAPGTPADPRSDGPDLTPVAIAAGAIVGVAVGSIVGWELIPVYAGMNPEVALGVTTNGADAAASTPVTAAVMARASAVMTIAQTAGAVIGGYVGAVLYWRANPGRP
jgi:hypothetical protein